MGSNFGKRAFTAVVLASAVIATSASRAGGQTTEELQRELNSMREELRELRKKMQKQDELIEKLTRERAPAPAAAAAPTLAATPALAEQQQEIERRVTENVMREVQPSLAAANRTFPSQFNPAISVGLDNAFAYRQHQGSNLEFRSAELGLSASVDPYARGYAFFNGTPDGVSVEEAAIVTTSLPYNLTVKGGRFFADFGRLSKFHDHDLPFVNRPIVLDEFVGGESQADGLEVSYLLPTEQYVAITGGWYNKMGADNFQVDNLVPRDLNQFTYLIHPATFFSLNDSNSVDVGASYAYTPKIDSFELDGTTELRNGKPRDLAGIDVTYRYIPLGQGLYRGLTWGTEVLYNHQTFNDGTEDDPVFVPTDAWGMYSYVEAKVTRVLSPGFLFQYTQPIDRQSGATASYSPYLTLWASEFQRFRLQYAYLDGPEQHQNQFFAQWTVFLGSHVHGFRDR